MTDLLPDRQTIRVPVEDTGLGEDHLYITITSGDLTHESLLKVLGALGKSKAAVEVKIEPQAPPLLVSVQRAAEITGTTPTFIRALIAAGYLKPARWSDRGEKDGRTSVEVADATGNFTGWSIAIPYDQIVELVTRARERGRFDMPVHSRPPASRYRSNGLKRSAASLAREALQSATDVDGEQQWMTVDAVWRRAIELNNALPPARRLDNIVKVTVGDALLKGEKRGLMQVRVAGYDPDNPKASGKMLEYRWRPDDERAAQAAAEAAAEYERIKPAGWVEVTPEPPTEERLLLRMLEQGDEATKARLRELLAAADDGASDTTPDMPPPRPKAPRRQTTGARKPSAPRAKRVEP